MERVEPGVTTAQLDRLAEVRPSRAIEGFPASVCASVNDQIVHGIPNQAPLREGDILSLDVGVCLEGYYGDAAWTYPVGVIQPELQRLLQVTRDALFKGIAKILAGNRVSDISASIQQHVESQGFSVVREFVGHGIGLALHEDPQVPNYGRPGRGPRLREGMVLAIEPMVNTGGPESRVLEDQWTAVTVDGGCSAHFEHSVAVTENGPWILSALE